MHSTTETSHILVLKLTTHNSYNPLLRVSLTADLQLDGTAAKTATAMPLQIMALFCTSRMLSGREMKLLGQYLTKEGAGYGEVKIYALNLVIQYYEGRIIYYEGRTNAFINGF